MAFRNSTFYPIGNQSGRSHAPAKYIYRTDDSIATIVSADYFNDIRSKLSEGDEIEVQFVIFVSETDDSYTEVTGGSKVIVAYNRGNIIHVMEVSNTSSLLFGTIPDISTAGTAIGGGAATDGNLDLVVQSGGEIVRIMTILGGAITGGDAVITPGNQTTNTTFANGTITIANAGSAIGDMDTGLPKGLSHMQPGQTMRLVSDGGSTNSVPVYVMCEIQDELHQHIYLTTVIPNISTAASAGSVVMPVEGTIVSVNVINYADVTNANAVLTTSIGTGAGETAITGGVLTVIADAGAKDVYTVYPTAANIASIGDYLTVSSDGGSTNACPATVMFDILLT